MKTASDNRRENLRLIAQELGGQSALAKLLDKSESEISAQIGSAPKRGIGPRLARRYEKILGKPHGFLDQPTMSDPVSMELVMVYQAATKEGRELMRKIMELVKEQYLDREKLASSR